MISRMRSVLAERGRRRSVRIAAICLLFVAALGTGIAWVFASPVASSPDDGYHQTSIWCPPPAEGSSCEVQLGEDNYVEAVQVPSLLVLGKCFQFQPETSANCQLDFDPDSEIWYTHFDRGGYPGGFYHVMNVFVGEDVTSSVLVMRTVNVVIAVALLGSVLLVAERPARRMGAYAVLVSAVPLGMFVVGSVNPSGWAFTGLAGLTIALHAGFSTYSRRRWIALTALAVVAAILAASARGDVGAYTVMVSGLLVLLHWSTIRTEWVRAIGPVLTAVIGSWGYLRAGQGAALGTGFGEDMGRDPIQTLWYNIFELPTVVLGMFGLDGGLGWLDTRMPSLTSAGMLLIVGGIVLVGLRKLDWSKAVVLGVLIAALITLPLYMLQQSHNIVGEQVQSRYLLPLIPVILCMTLIYRRTRVVAFSRAQAVAVWLVLTAAHSAALHTNINRYTVGLDVRVVNLNHQLEWWWWENATLGPMKIWAIGSIGFAVLACTLIALRTDRVTAAYVAEDGSGHAQTADPAALTALATAEPTYYAKAIAVAESKPTAASFEPTGDRPQPHSE